MSRRRDGILVYRNDVPARLGGKTRNSEVASLLARAYDLTSVPLRTYRPGMFWTPEVLVTGDIGPAYVRTVPESAQQKNIEPSAAGEA